MPINHGFSCKKRHWILSLVCAVLCILLISSCTSNNPSPTQSPKPVSAPASEVLQLNSEPIPEPATEPETKSEPEQIIVPKDSQQFAFSLKKSSQMRLGKPVGSYFSISKNLNAGNKVSGFVEINDSPGETVTSNTGSWYLEVFNPRGDKIYSKITYGENNFKFYFEAKEPGEYTTKIVHYFNSEKLLFLKIWPGGWRIEHIDGSIISDFS